MLALTHPALSAIEQQQLLWWGMFFGFAPDLDMFWVFIKTKRFVASDKTNHRQFFSHAPVLWLLGGLAVFLFGLMQQDLFFEYLGVAVWLGSWSHFVFDSVQHGVMWLWPWGREPLALFDRGVKDDIPLQAFLSYWVKSVKFYVTRFVISFVLELTVIFAALLVYFW
jgi:hypothetical protein